MKNNNKDNVKINAKIMDNNYDKITDKNDKRGIKEGKNADKKSNLLSEILGYFFDSTERHNLDNKKVNKVIKEMQYLFKKDPKQRGKKCFTCEEN